MPLSHHVLAVLATSTASAGKGGGSSLGNFLPLVLIALVAYGGAEATTVAAVLVYRLLSFWASLPIGWGTAVVLEIRRRTGRGDARAGESELVRA